MPADVHALSGAYAVDALRPLERADFEAHLARCETCRLEVATLREAATHLSSGVATSPPARLRAVILAAVARLPQSRRVVALPRRPRQDRTRWVPVLVAAAAFLAIAGSTYTFVRVPDKSTPVSAETVFAAPDVRARVVTSSAGTFQIATSRELGLLAVQADQPPGEQTYQLWVITDRARSLGVLDEPGAFAPIPGQGRLAITVEPIGGSPQPTTLPLFAVDLAKL